MSHETVDHQSYLEVLVAETFEGLAGFSVAGAVSFEIQFRDADVGANNKISFSVTPPAGGGSDESPARGGLGFSERTG